MASHAPGILAAFALALSPLAPSSQPRAEVTQAGTYQFRILKDDPRAVADKILSLSIATAHFSGAEGLKVGAGVDALWGLMDRLQLQGDSITTT